MRTINDIYEHYEIMPSLREHMLRVASVAGLICDNTEVSIDKENVIKAALLHDIGNIIKFKLEIFPEFTEPLGLAYWQEVQRKFIEKYGEDEHQATLHILEELELPEAVVSLADGIRFSNLCKHRDSENMNIKIIHYADSIVGPHGVQSFEGRMAEAGERYKNHKNRVGEEDKIKFYNCGKEIETQIFSKCKIKPADITDLSVAPIIEELRSFVIK